MPFLHLERRGMGGEPQPVLGELPPDIPAGELWDASRRHAEITDRSDSLDIIFGDVYDQIIEDAGLSIANPYTDKGDAMYMPLYEFYTGRGGRYTRDQDRERIRLGNPKVMAATREKMFWDEFNKQMWLKGEQEITDGPQRVRQLVPVQARKEVAKWEETEKRMRGPGDVLTSFAAHSFEVMTDPVMAALTVATLPLGLSGAAFSRMGAWQAIGQAAGRGAGIEAGIEAVRQVQVQQARRDTGQDYGAQLAMDNIMFAGIAGGVLSGSAGAGGKYLQRRRERRAQTGEPSAESTEELAAELVLETDVHIEDMIPDEGGAVRAFDSDTEFTDELMDAGGKAEIEKALEKKPKRKKLVVKLKKPYDKVSGPEKLAKAMEEDAPEAPLRAEDAERHISSIEEAANKEMDQVMADGKAAITKDGAAGKKGKAAAAKKEGDAGVSGSDTPSPYDSLDAEGKRNVQGVAKLRILCGLGEG